MPQRIMPLLPQPTVRSLDPAVACRNKQLAHVIIRGPDSFKRHKHALMLLQ